ncbi:Rop family plasmid primer RNA-binding protein, partial [Escherichia coli]
MPKQEKTALYMARFIR